MNKQEVIEEIKKLEGLTILDKTINFDSKMIPRKKVLNIVNQIDGPEKTVVPQYVADFYESIKDDFEDGVYGLCAEFYEKKSELSTELYWWFKLDVNKPIETLVKMKLYGYEVEKEKLYEVFLKRNGAQLGVCIPDGEDKTQFTAEELKEFELDSLDAYEVKEVEE